MGWGDNGHYIRRLPGLAVLVGLFLACSDSVVVECVWTVWQPQVKTERVLFGKCFVVCGKVCYSFTSELFVIVLSVAMATMYRTISWWCAVHTRYSLHWRWGQYTALTFVVLFCDFVDINNGILCSTEEFVAYCQAP